MEMNYNFHQLFQSFRGITKKPFICNNFHCILEKNNSILSHLLPEASGTYNMNYFFFVLFFLWNCRIQLREKNLFYGIQQIPMVFIK